MSHTVLRSELPRVKAFARPMNSEAADAVKGLVGGFDNVLPGINQLDADAFARLSANADFQKELKAGKFQVVEGGAASESEGETEAVALERFTVAEAVQLVGETENTGLLRNWRELDARAQVIAAIDKKLAAIDKERAGGDEIPTS